MVNFLLKGTVVKLDSWFRRGLSVVRWKHVDAVTRKSEDTQSASEVPEEKTELCFERPLGDTELSYYLPSRGDGVNDMCVFKFKSFTREYSLTSRYLQLGCRLNPSLIERNRVCLIWAILRLCHPLLASNVRMNDYNDVRFG